MDDQEETLFYMTASLQREEVQGSQKKALYSADPLDSISEPQHFFPAVN